MMRECFVFDIDGTLADNAHRLHYLDGTPKNWDGWYANVEHDGVHPHVALLAQIIMERYPVIFVSGRRNEVRLQTLVWLRANKLIPALFWDSSCRGYPGNALEVWRILSDGEGRGWLYMRGDGDRRDDRVVKHELMNQAMREGWKPIMVFDDRASVVAMWRDRGIPCAQVAEGNF